MVSLGPLRGDFISMPFFLVLFSSGLKDNANNLNLTGVRNV